MTRELTNAEVTPDLGLLGYASAPSAPSAWHAKTPWQILDDVNWALAQCLAATTYKGPEELALPGWAFWLLQRPLIARLIRQRRQRRPKKFTRRCV